MITYTCLQNVKILVGENIHIKIGEALKEAGYKKAFLVYDGGVKAAGIIDRITASLKVSNLEYAEFDKVLPDPPADIVNEGGALCMELQCDCVIGIGGGSAIDTAKGINVLRVNGGSILEYANPEKEMKRCPGLMSVPTTSGTGSELSSGMIISDTSTDTKVAILSENSMSEFAVIDPVFTVGMPVGLTIMTGLDAFSHAAEGYTSVLANPMTDMITKAIMENVIEYLPRAVKNGSDMEARTNMHIAASLGGWMLANPAAHVGHSIAHAIGAIYHIPHGACCAYSLPVVLEKLAEELPDKVKAIGKLFGVEFDGLETAEQIGSKTSAAYKKFAYKTVGIKPIKEFYEGTTDYDMLAKRISTDPLCNLAPINITEDVALDFIKKIFN